MNLATSATASYTNQSATVQSLPLSEPVATKLPLSSILNPLTAATLETLPHNAEFSNKPIDSATNDVVNQDITASKCFIQALGNPINFRTFSDKGKNKTQLNRKLADEFDALKEQLVYLNNEGAGIFVIINERGQADCDITKIRAVFADFDGTPIPHEFGLQPSIIVQSSIAGKIHVYWLIEGDFPVAQFKPVQQAIAHKYRSDLKVCNPSRVMRLPGFIHNKNEPVQTQLISCDTSIQYTYEQLAREFKLEVISLKTGHKVPGSGQIPEGGRNSHLASEAGRMRRLGMEEPEILANLHAINEQCNPMLDDSEVEGIARSIVRYEPAPVASLTEGTELAIAYRLKELADGNIRYIQERGIFAIWNGDRWFLDGSGSGFMQSYELLIQHEMAEAMADTTQREGRLRLAIRLQAKKTIDNICSLLKRLPGIPIGLDDFDDNPYLFQVNNGVVNLNTCEFRPARKEDLCLRRSPVNYDPAATSPAFEKLLLWAMKDDPTRCAFLQRLFGYLMVGHAQEEVLPIFQGNGANGKSTIREVIRRALGDYAMVAPPGLLVNRDSKAQTNDIARLAGARAVFVSETDENDKLAESTVKYITQQENIAARFLNHEFFEFKPRFKCILATNHKPTVRGSDGGIWRRLILIPFENSIPADERDVHFVDKVLMPELSGILAWMVAGAKEYNKVGLKIPASIKAATDEYRDNSDVYGEFFVDSVIESASDSVTTAILWIKFASWYFINFGTQSPQWLSARGLGRWLADKGYSPCRGSSGRGYSGLKLKESATPMAQVMDSLHSATRV